MDARVISKAILPTRHATGTRVLSGRTLAEMGAHVFLPKQAGGIVRLDVADGKAEQVWLHMEPAERAKERKLRRTGYRSGARRKCAHAHGSFLLPGFVGRPDAKEAQCHADM